VRFKAVDDGHGGTKIVPNMALAKPLAAQTAAEKQDSGHHPTANAAAATSVSTDNFRFGDLAGFGQRGEHGSASLDLNLSLGAESAASSHDTLQQTMIGGFHLDFASVTVSPIGQHHFVNPVHGDFIL
jgi:hypothetical protein